MLFCGIAAASPIATNANAVTLNLIDLGGVTGSPVDQGFEADAHRWESVLTSRVTMICATGSRPCVECDLPVVRSTEPGPGRQ